MGGWYGGVGGDGDRCGLAALVASVASVHSVPPEPIGRCGVIRQGWGRAPRSDGERRRGLDWMGDHDTVLYCTVHWGGVLGDLQDSCSTANRRVRSV